MTRQPWDELADEPGECQFSVDHDDGRGYTRYTYNENGDPFVIEVFREWEHKEDDE